MSKRRAAILATRSLITLTNGRSISSVSNLSTAVEWEEYQNVNNATDHSLHNYQNHAQFNSDTQNLMYTQNSTSQNSSPPYRENSDGFYSEKQNHYGDLPPSSYYGFNQDPNGSHRDTCSNSHQVGQNGNFVDHGIDNGRMVQNHNGFNQNSDVSGAARSQSHNIPIERRENLIACNGYNNGKIQQNTNGVYGQNSWGIWTESRQRNLNGLVEGNGDKQKAHGSNQEVFKHTIQHSNVFNSGEFSGHMGNVGKFQSPDVIQMGKIEMNQQNAGTYQQNPNAGIYEHVTGPNYHNTMSGPNNQKNFISGQYPQNLNYGQFQPRAAIEQYQPNPNTAKSSMINAQALNNINADGQTTELTNNRQFLEELDEFCKEGKLQEAVEVLELLEKQHIPVDLARCLQLIRACGEAKSLQEAKVVCNYVIKSQSPLEVGTYNKILEMYSKCGSMDDAYMVFNKMPSHNLTSWDTMITWLAKNGLGEDAVDFFYEFKNSGLSPDGKMFLGVFSACSFLGDVDEGMLHFESMTKIYGIIPSMVHYVSVVDMLGSVGYVDEALEFIEKMPLEPGVDIWETMMNISRAHGLVELGDSCAELVEQLDSDRLNDQSKVGLLPVKASDLTKERERKTLANQNLLEVKIQSHQYRAGDTSHPENYKIYALLRGLREQMKEAGYIPETRFVLHDIDQEGKNDALLAHSERLAVAHGLLTSSARSPMRVIKNLRVCGDCHSALKIISKIVGRLLVIRDAKRFHHFENGLCSCHDYW